MRGGHEVAWDVEEVIRVIREREVGLEFGDWIDTFCGF
jgi:hypothetical protein